MKRLEGARGGGRILRSLYARFLILMAALTPAVIALIEEGARGG